MKVYEDRGNSRPHGSTKQLKASKTLYRSMSADVLPVPSERKVRKIGRLSRVISTKMSEADDIFLQQMTDTAYQVGAIKERSKSELLRLILAMVFGELKNRPDLIHFIKKNR